MGACDLAGVIGCAVALNLLFGIPLAWGIVITSLDVLIVLYMQHKGFRLLEALVVVLIATIAGCFLFEILISKPDAAAVFAGFIPSASILKDPDKLYIAIGILGATVSITVAPRMPIAMYSLSGSLRIDALGMNSAKTAAASSFEVRISDKKPPAN